MCGNVYRCKGMPNIVIYKSKLTKQIYILLSGWSGTCIISEDMADTMTAKKEELQPLEYYDRHASSWEKYKKLLLGNIMTLSTTVFYTSSLSSLQVIQGSIGEVQKKYTLNRNFNISYVFLNFVFNGMHCKGPTQLVEATTGGQHQVWKFVF